MTPIPCFIVSFTNCPAFIFIFFPSQSRLQSLFGSHIPIALSRLSFCIWYYLIDPFMFTITADKDQSQGISLSDIGLEKDGLIVIAVATLGILWSCQCWIILNGRGHRMQNVSHFLAQFIPINQGLVGGWFGITAQSTCILERSIAFILLRIIILETRKNMRKRSYMCILQFQANLGGDYGVPAALPCTSRVS